MFTYRYVISYKYTQFIFTHQQQKKPVVSTYNTCQIAIFSYISYYGYCVTCNFHNVQVPVFCIDCYLWCTIKSDYYYYYCSSDIISFGEFDGLRFIPKWLNQVMVQKIIKIFIFHIKFSLIRKLITYIDQGVLTKMFTRRC